MHQKEGTKCHENEIWTVFENKTDIESKKVWHSSFKCDKNLKKRRQAKFTV